MQAFKRARQTPRDPSFWRRTLPRRRSRLATVSCRYPPDHRCESDCHIALSTTFSEFRRHRPSQMKKMKKTGVRYCCAFLPDVLGMWRCRTPAPRARARRGQRRRIWTESPRTGSRCPPRRRASGACPRELPHLVVPPVVQVQDAEKLLYPGVEPVLLEPLRRTVASRSR
jgi:hypothetical protein